MKQLLALLLLATVARADVVTDWNEAALAAIRADKTPPPKAARARAIVHVAIYDAVNGITQTHERYLVTGKPKAGASVEAAASAAAHIALGRMFPAQQAAFDATYNRTLATFASDPGKSAGVEWGQWVATVVLTSRASDGTENPVTWVPKDAPGEWQPTPPASAPALLPQWPKVTCFAMTSATQFRPPRMPALTSAVYAVDLNLTKQLGAKDSLARTAEQTAIAQFWADGPGTVTPPGHWNVVARDLALQRRLSLVENARLFALLNIAEADAAILCWDCKYACIFWRPITAIQNADQDKNPATEKDAHWTPLLATPPFPEYTSGHSTFSGAAAAVLAAFFGTDEVPFSATSEAMQGFSRTDQSFSEAAAEAGLSRIFGGIHFMSANTQGLASGNKLGEFVAQNFLQAKRAASSGARFHAVRPGSDLSIGSDSPSSCWRPPFATAFPIVSITTSAQADRSAMAPLLPRMRPPTKPHS